MDRAVRVELFSVPDRGIIPAEGWPDAFWRHAGERVLLSEAESRQVIRLFRDLDPREPARCHMPLWGLALYAGDAQLVTVTFCYVCSNAYVYDGHGMDLRAFETVKPNAAALRRVLEAAASARWRGSIPGPSRRSGA